MVLKYRVFLGVVLCLMFAILVVCQTPIKECKENEVQIDYTIYPSICAPHCPRVERIGVACTLHNGTQCICKSGWVYDINGTCIPEKYCAALGDPNAEFSNCDAACQVTCDCLKPQISQSIACRCDRTCVPGYICRQGYIRNATAGYCIPSCDCPK